MRKLALILVISSYFLSFPLLAKIEINFSKVQFFLNDQKRTDSFNVRNQGSDDAYCSIKLAHYLVSEDGILRRLEEGVAGVYNPANKLVRHSPRSVNIPAYSSQSVRISFRRIPKLAEGEYISYLRVQCKQSKYGIDFLTQRDDGAKLSYHLPVVLRYGSVNSDSQITSAKLVKLDDAAYVEIKHERLPVATGSAIGDYEVIGTETGKVYGLVRGAKVYAPAKFNITKVNLSEKPTESLQVRFVTNPELGTLVLIKDVAN